MVKKTFKRRNLIHYGIIRIRLYLVRYKAGNTNMINKAFDIADSLIYLEIISCDKYDLLMDIIKREFVD